LRGDILDGKHKMKLDAKDEKTFEKGMIFKQRKFDMYSSYSFGGKSHSKANLNWNFEDDMKKTKDMKLALSAGFETPFSSNEKYSFDFDHLTSSNTQQFKTKVNVIPGNPGKTLTITNDASYKVVEQTVSFENKMNLITPFAYLKNVKLDVDGNLKQGAVLEGKMVGNWNAKPLELKLQLDKDHQKIGKQIYKVDGKFDQMQTSATFSITKKNYKPDGQWKGDTSYEFKVVDTNKGESSVKFTLEDDNKTFMLTAKVPKTISPDEFKIIQKYAVENGSKISLMLKVTLGSTDYIDFNGTCSSFRRSLSKLRHGRRIQIPRMEIGRMENKRPFGLCST